MLVELAFDRRADPLGTLAHRFHVLVGPAGGEAARYAYTAATFPLDAGVPVVRRPLAGILAVAGGTVVSTQSTLADQVPGRLPDPSTITLEE